MEADAMQDTVPLFTFRPRQLAACLALALAIGAASDAGGKPGGMQPTAADARLRAEWRSTLPLLPRAPSLGPTTVVQNCNDDGPGSLREAYFNAVDEEVIDLGQLTCSTITLTTGALTNAPAAATITLQGPGKYALTVDGGNAGRVLVHNGSGNLEVLGLTVTRGSYHGSYGGGCIYSHGGVVAYQSIISSCSMSSSGTAKAYGGAIYARATALVFGSTVRDSTAHADAAHSAGAGIWADKVQVIASTISGNTASGDGSHYARGGGVFALGDAQIKYSTISDNEAINGAGVFLVGAASEPMRIVNSTISGNRASGAGGGVYSKYRPLQVSNSTITQNTSGFPFGAGLYLATETDLQSTIVANNTSQDGLSASDIGGLSTVTLSGANNLVIASTLALPPGTISTEPMLGSLQDNGGVSKTHALLVGSPAIDQGNVAVAAVYDQRIVDIKTNRPFERVVGPSADIGAFEFGAPDRILTDGFEFP
jgi:hypothetical protein